MMPSRRRIVVVLTLLLLSAPALAPSGPVLAQEGQQPPARKAGAEERLSDALEDLRVLKSGMCPDRHRLYVMRRAERDLKRILQAYPNTPLRGRAEATLSEVRELLAEHLFGVARFYVDRAGRSSSAKEAEARLLEFAREFPDFPGSDEVLFMLGSVSLMEGSERDAANYFWKLVCQFPASARADEAFGHLGRIGMDASRGCDNSRPE